MNKCPRPSRDHKGVGHSRASYHNCACYLLIAFIFLTAGPPARALDAQTDLHHLGYQTWRTENGLPQNTVHAILQTHDGFIWLATEGGLVRFDGVRFVVYDRQNTRELKNNNIRALAEDHDGALWIATADGLLRFKGANHLAFTTREGLPSDNVWSVQVDKAGQIWAATTDGLAHWENNHFIPLNTNGGTISAIAEGPGNSFWIATGDALKLFRSGRLEEMRSQPAISKADIEVLLIDSSDRRWFGTAKGLVVQSGANTTLYTTANGLPSNHITALYLDREGSVWIGTDAGAARVSNGQVQRFSPGQPLSGSAILSFNEDLEGDMWAGTEADGVTILRHQKFSTFTHSESAVRCVFEDHDGVVWMGTAGHGITRFANGRFSAFTTKDGLSSDQVFALGEDSDGNLLAGTPDGLNRIRNGKVSLLTSADGLADDFVRSVFCDRDGSLWIGTRRGLSHFTAGHFETYTQRNGLGSDLVGAVIRTRNGDLWIGTLHGLSRLSHGQITNFTTQNGLSTNVITALHEDGAGTLWIGTEDGGLNSYRNGNFSYLRAALGVPPTIYGLTEDHLRNLWMPASTGIYRADLRQGESTVISYGTSDGLRISECTGGGHPAIWQAHDGALWFATPKGAAVLRPEDAQINRVPPPVVIESVSIDDRSLDPAKLRELSPGPARISFEYAGLSFVAPQKVIFRYRLEGFDREWIDAGTRRVAYYTNLSPGDYHFRVLARNNDGIWSESGATLNFRLLPHFYQTYWFAVLMLFALGLCGYAAYRWRVREVESRFNAVLEERSRIAREIHDTLSQGFVAVSVQLEVIARLLASSSDNVKQHLDQARGMVRDSLSEARTAIWALRSQSAGQDDLASRLSQTAGQVTALSSVKVRMKVHGTYHPLGSLMEDELVRIGKEAVTNVVRHANAENIDIELSFEPKSLRLTISDDGGGFVLASNGSGPSGHYGLQGMRERAAQIHAELIIQSAPGEGTRVSVEAKLS